MTYYSDDWLQIHEGDCSEVMGTLPEGGVHTIITSPPYYNLRDYGHGNQLGQESTPEEYIEHLVQVFEVAKRALRHDGLLWLNLGDSFGPKGLLGIPWRVAFALQSHGWLLRRDIIWSKPNPMPESVSNRPTSSHEYIFMLAKSKNYFYDAHAVKEPISEAMAAAIARGPSKRQHDEHYGDGNGIGGRSITDSDSLARVAFGRSRRSVWNIPTVSYPGAHYATFPPKLVEPMIQAATPEVGACESCGSPAVRQVEITRMDHHQTTKDGKTADGPYAAQAAIRSGVYVDTETVGWERTCDHGERLVPATVLDPFAGSGTVGMVANRLSRRAVLIDINADYLKLQLQRNVAVPLGL
jgi:DNA modification methylase